jgi:hypothetical protein
VKLSELSVQKREYLKDKINELETNGKKRNGEEMHRGIYEFKKGYQLWTNLVTDVNDDLLADSHNILNRQKNFFCQVLTVYGVNDVR